MTTLQTFIKEREERLDRESIDLDFMDRAGSIIRPTKETLEKIKSFPRQFAQDLLALVAEEVGEMKGIQYDIKADSNYEKYIPESKVLSLLRSEIKE